MSNTLKYYDTDFKNATQVNLEQLQEIIAQSSISSATIQSGSYTENGDDFEVDLVFNTMLSFGDKLTLDDIIENYIYNPFDDTNATIKNVKLTGTNGGTFTAGAWQIRELNTTEGDMKFAKLASNVITLIEGNYTIYIKCLACDVRNHQCRLWNITDSAVAIMGSNSYSYGGIMTSSDIYNILKINGEKQFRIEHICSDTSENIGFGKATGFASDEVYVIMSIQQI